MPSAALPGIDSMLDREEEQEEEEWLPFMFDGIDGEVVPVSLLWRCHVVLFYEMFLLR